MKLRKPYIFTLLSIAAMLVQGCTTDMTDHRDLEYGYVQFKLYKAASYDAATFASRSEVLEQLEYLGDAHKIEVSLTTENGVNIKQNLVLNYYDKESAEYGVRSDKLKLLTGTYSLGRIVLYDALDNAIYRDVPDAEAKFTVAASGLVMHDIVIDVVPRGKARFTIKKDFSDFTNIPTTRGEVVREYMLDEVKFVDVVLKKVAENEVAFGNPIELRRLPAKYEEYYDPNDGKENYKLSRLDCDTLLSLEANRYRIIAYKTYDSKKVLLEEYDTPAPASEDFYVQDNEIVDVDVKVKLHEADEYIKDYYALYEIWKSLGGENWYYDGENYPRGANWDFNRDVDLWYQQHGVFVHSNGRVARLDLGEFGIRGELPDAIGQLTELVELYLGTHNDGNVLYDPSLDLSKSSMDRQTNRMEYHKQYLASLHQPVQMSEPCARALAEHNIKIPATSLYEKYKESEIIDRETGIQRKLVLHDINHGTIINGLTKISPEIGKCTKLAQFYIANGLVEEIPSTVKNLVSCTDFEIYNCPKMTKFPMEIAAMPALEQINISNNKQWSSEEVDAGMSALANGASKELLQIIYARENNITKVSQEYANFKKIGLLDLAYNKIEEVVALGEEISFTQLYLDHNKIKSIPQNFCKIDDIETFSVSHNLLTKVPNIFDAKSKYTISSVDFSSNLIDGFEGEEDGTYKGIRVETFTLSRNPKLTKYPTALAKTNSEVAYIILSACEIDEIPEGSFVYERSINLVSIDLSYNNLTKLPRELHSGNMPYLYGFDISFNRFSHFPFEPLDSAYLTVFGIRSQRDENGARCLREWPTGLYNHTGLRGFYIGSNDLRTIDDTISTRIYYLDISDNPNIVFDASDICYAWQVGAYILYYDKSQKILNCDAMLE